MITQRKQSKIYVLAECAILVALGTVLSLLKLVDLPYGGSVTVASMLPLLIISYRHGMVWGLGCGLVYGAIQQLLGLNTLNYFSTFGSILAVILLDYVVAFAVVGLGGMFRKAVRNESVALAGGALVTGLLRYLCHVISGATVWAGISIPTKAAIGYSLIYNATYMIPETLVLMLVAFSVLQDPESGEFNITGLTEAGSKFYITLIVVSAVCIVFSLVVTILSRKIERTEKTDA